MRPEDISCAQFFQQKRKVLFFFFFIYCKGNRLLGRCLVLAQKLGSYGVVLPFKATEVLNAGASPSQRIQPLGPKVLGTFDEVVSMPRGG